LLKNKKLKYRNELLLKEAMKIKIPIKIKKPFVANLGYNLKEVQLLFIDLNQTIKKWIKMKFELN